MGYLRTLASLRPSISQLGTIFTNISAITLYIIRHSDTPFLRSYQNLAGRNECLIWACVVVKLHKGFFHAFLWVAHLMKLQDSSMHVSTVMEHIKKVSEERANERTDGQADEQTLTPLTSFSSLSTPRPFHYCGCCHHENMPI